jgi:predicted RNA-binding protein with PIN domain
VAPVALVDAENVRRSKWPNLTREELLDRARRWAGREGVRVIVVFDGEAPEVDTPDVVGSDSGSADDRIVRLAATLEGPIWVVTSDRELRDRVGRNAARVIGGGAFVRLLLED